MKLRQLTFPETTWLWPPYVIGQAIIFFQCGFYLSSFYLFPRLISAVRDWMSSLPYFCIWCGLSANLESMSEMCCTRLAANTGRKNLPFWHHPTTLSACIFAAKACIDNRKKDVKQKYLLHKTHNMVNFGLLTAEICWRVWGTPAHFNGFCILAALLHGTLVVGVSQTLRRWTDGATYIRQRGHHVGHWPTFLVVIILAKGYCTLFSVCRLSLILSPYDWLSHPTYKSCVLLLRLITLLVLMSAQTRFASVVICTLHLLSVGTCECTWQVCLAAFPPPIDVNSPPYYTVIFCLEDLHVIMANNWHWRRLKDGNERRSRTPYSTVQ